MISENNYLRLWPKYLTLTLFIIWSCSNETVPVSPTMEPDIVVLDSLWSIPFSQVYSGGPGKDGIPALDYPKVVSTDIADHLEPNDLVIGYKSGDEVRAYPHSILDWHEIINDELDQEKIAITYCPLTGTGLGWNRVIDGQETTFGVSGLLYNTNLMPYDRNTESIWSQLLNSCVNGQLKDTTIKVFPLLETTWRTWKKMYPNSTVVSNETDYAMPYGVYPYGNYRDTEKLIFPVSTKDDQLFAKERVLGVFLEWGAKVYRFSSIDPNNSGKINLIHDNFGPQHLLIIGNMDFMVAFKPSGIEKAYEFKPLQNELPLVVKDNLGNKYDCFGFVATGPNQGEQLDTVEFIIGYYFAIAAFHPNPQVYND